MKKVLGMMPGMGSLMKDVDVDDRQMQRLDALFTSMTPKERLHPEVLDVSRRRRIAKGAGQDLSAVNDLMRSYKGMKQMMKQMNKLGLGAKLGSKAKKDALRGMSADGELAADGGGGLFGGGGLGGLFGGGGAPDPGALAGMGGPGGGLEGMLGGGGRPMGSSPTRKRAASRKDKKAKRKKGRKGGKRR